MARMRHRETGSEVVVPDEKAAVLYGMGYDYVDKKPAAKKTAKSSK
jgi:hypothetical protein